MSSTAQIAANIANARSSSGPRTVEGKATSSRNAVTLGLFTRADFIRPGEEAAYARLNDALQSDLTPSGVLEHNLVDEIRRAMWRLARCGEVEASFVAAFSTGSEPAPDPMQNESTASLQYSVDRARAQSHRLLHRCTAELRRLQTERCFRDEIFTGDMDTSGIGLADYRAITKSMADDNRGQMLRRKLKDLHSLKSVLEMSLPETPPTSSESPLDLFGINRNAAANAAGKSDPIRWLARQGNSPQRPMHLQFGPEIQALLRTKRARHAHSRLIRPPKHRAPAALWPDHNLDKIKQLF